MKIMTLNTHSLIEENYPQKLADFASAIADIKPEIIALQEVNQRAIQKPVKKKICGYFPCSEHTVIRSDNHIYRVSERLLQMGIQYYWTWLPIKNGYEKYEEGIAVMSRSPIVETDVLQVSGINDYSNWKTRKIVGVRTEKIPDEWFFSVHYGWWDDSTEMFCDQWNRTNEYMKKYDNVWLLGDFNNPDEVRGEGYDLMKKSNWYDSYELALKKDNGITVGIVIDGWKEKISDTKGMRIDQIWCKRKPKVTASEVIFNGNNYPVVSDHFGVIIDYERSLS